jgi:ribosomal protein L11 methylase PrmA
VNEPHILPSSFRDPSGFVFLRDGVLCRQVNEIHSEHYDRFMESGLYEALVSEGLLVAHEEIGLDRAFSSEAYKVLRPEPVEFVSYPYEWSFSQLQDAALLTLEAQRVAMKHGMSLRDATAYNVQFRGPRPVLIDTLSFEVLPEGRPWVAYRQFCQHFLAPLALMGFRDLRLGRLSLGHIDGIPLDLAATLLPWTARLRPGLLMHLFLHARSQRRHRDEGRSSIERREGSFGDRAFQGLIESLEKAVAGLRLRRTDRQWIEYYARATHYSSEALEHKVALVAQSIDEVAPSTVWDLGSNTGLFGRIAAERGIQTVCLEMDAACVEESYRRARDNDETHVLPLVADFDNPSPSIGWANDERASLVERGPADLALALALVHHLAIANNVPLGRIAEFLARVCSRLVIEFVPKGDEKVQQLLQRRDDIFADYSQEGFERAFGDWFDIQSAKPIRGSERVLYLMKAR